jgi:hypothetical protein
MSVTIPVKTAPSGVWMSISYMRGDLLATRTWWPRDPPVSALNARLSAVSPSRSMSIVSAF